MHGAMFLLFFGFIFSSFTNQKNGSPVFSPELPGIKDTIDDDSLRYPFDDYKNIPSFYNSSSPLHLNKPSNVESKVEYNPKTGKFIFYDKIGEMNYRNPHYMSFDEYLDYELKRSTKEYWMERSALESTKEGDAGMIDKLINAKLVVPIKGFDKIFGSNVISIKPQGNAELIFGINTSKVENPALAENLQRTVTFDFDMKIKMGVNGKIGDKMNLGINYDTEATFEFENNVKLAYEGEEDDIIQKIEAGNVSLPLSGTLITGSHSLFGLKTELKFGKLSVTSVVSQQKSEIQTIEIEGGAMTTPFEITADDYEAGRHFFLAHYFRDRYNEALKSLPVIRTNVNITRVEVWVTNRSGNFENSRNIIAFTDLAESQEYLNSNFFSATGTYPDNETNSLYSAMNTEYAGIRNINNASALLSTIPEFNAGEDYEKVQNARLLTQSEFTFSSSLGYISLNSSLNNDEVLAVAFEYTAGGKTYRVGEFSNETPAPPEAMFLKLMKPTMLSTELPLWDLMMKNVYSINAYQVNSEDFVLNVMYRDDKNGNSINYISEGNINGEILLRVMGLDNLNKNNEPGADGFFDFINTVTINATNGKIYFPVLEPFGEHLREKITGGSVDPELNRIAEQYVFQELYDQTQSQARQAAEKNKFFIKGSYRSAGGSEINLNAMNVPQGSVKVTAGGRELVENTDYTVDYNLGRVTILNHGLLESGTPIKISLENNSMFNIGTKTFLGTHLDYRVSENINIGATLLHLNQKPLTKKINIGNEPIANTIWGLDLNLNQEVPFMTKMVDKIPFIETKEKSSIDFTGEFAQLIPGHPDVIGETGFAHIDDFEGTKTTIDLKSVISWKIASTPQNQPELFPEGDLSDSITYGFNRAKLAWYNVNTDFLRNSGSTPGHITVDDQSDHRVREVYEQELFPNRDPIHGIPPVLQVLNLAYYPTEKGPYNYDVNGEAGISAGIEADGSLKNPETRWAGVMRDLVTNDFEEVNIEFIEFWMMDPFTYNPDQTGGNLYFNFGNISEDILRDSRQAFENGLPTSADITDVETTSWGRIPLLPRITEGFAIDPADARLLQDVGLDGLSDEDENTFFSDYLQEISQKYSTGSNAYEKATEDPSNDNYIFFKAAEYDSEQATILDRYKHFNNSENNSSISGETGQQTPDMEDINKDYTLSETETYFQYKIHIAPDEMEVGKNYITDVKKSSVKLKNDETEEIKWYHYKIPLDDIEKVVGSIQDFKSIRFARMFLKDWDEEVVLRFAELELVRGEWRKYKASLLAGNEGNGGQITDAAFDVSAVNIEENSYREPVNYVLPPGITREISINQPTTRELNEQSIVLRVFDLDDGDARAAYKNTTLDVRQFKKLQMYIHAEAIDDEILENDDICAFIRMGSDYTENYYEYEIPLKVTEKGYYINEDNADRLKVWPEENMLDIEFEIFQAVKQRRNSKMREPGSLLQITSEYSEYSNEGKRTSVTGNPNLSNIRTIMIGIRNRSMEKNIQDDDGLPKTVEIWLDELRLSEFNEQGGWASQARLSARFADFSTIAIAGDISTPGFGSLEKKVSERQKSTDYGYDFSSNFALGKFFPHKYGVRIPLFMGYSESFSDPQYNPLDPDILLSTTLSDPNLTSSEKDSIISISRDYIRRRSINVTNLQIRGNTEKNKKTDKLKKNINTKNTKKSKKKKKRGKSLFHISNFSTSYGYNEIFMQNINTHHNLLTEHSGAIAYNFNNSPKNIAPFKKIKFLRYKPLRIIKDFNFYLTPSMISFRNDMRKKYHEIQLRNIETPDVEMDPTFDKQFTWQRSYDLRYSLTRDLKFTYSATNNAWVDEPYGKIDEDDTFYEEKRDTLWNNIKNFGRTTDFNQKITGTWSIPISKLPLLGWTSANARYSADYFWTRGPITADTIKLGNSVRNAQNLQLTGQLNLSKVYRKIKFLKKVDDKMKKRNKSKKKKYKDIQYKEENLKLKKDRAKKITHNLKTKNSIKVKATDGSGKEIIGTTEVISENKIAFTPDTTIKNVTIIVEGKIEDKDNPLRIIADYTLYALMGIRNVSLTYSEKNSTGVPGYIPETKFFGMDNNWSAPGWRFVMGEQDPDFGRLAAESGWISDDTLVNAPIIRNNEVAYNFKASLKPIKGLKIDISADRRLGKTYNEFWVSRDGEFRAENKKIEGTFSMSFLAIRTAFWGMDNSTYSSKAYDNFLENRIIIAQQLADERNVSGSGYDPNQLNNFVIDSTMSQLVNSFPDGYSPNSQEVLIPAFLAAYSGSDADGAGTNPFPKIPLPNWRLKYDGLTSYEAIKKIFKRIIINHGYRSSYNVGSFATNPDFDFEQQQHLGFSYARYEQNETSTFFIPEFQIQGVIIDEKFVPLIGIDMTWNNDISTKLEYKKARSIALSFANNQILEMQNEEYTVGLGYKIPNLVIPIKIGESQQPVKSDLNIRADFTYRDNLSVIRRLQEADDQLSAGQSNLSLKINADYDINNSVTIRVFYDQVINTPKVSTSYRTSNAKFGFSIRFNLLPK